MSFTVSGDANHIYVSDYSGRIVATCPTVEDAEQVASALNRVDAEDNFRPFGRLDPDDPLDQASGYPSKLYEDLYGDWWSIEREVLRRASNGRSGRNFHATEVLWCNRPVDGRLFEREAAVLNG